MIKPNTVKPFYSLIINVRAISAMLCLAVLTMLFARFYDPYQVIGPELLVDPGFGEGLARWSSFGPTDAVIVEADGTVRLESNDPGKSVGIFQKIAAPQRFTWLRLAGSLQSRAVVAGSKSWHRARLVLAGYDRNGNWLPGPHHVVSLDGSHGWKRYSEVFRVDSGADELRAMAQLPHATGTLQVRGLSLHPVEPKPAFLLFKILFLSAWGALILWFFPPLIRSCRTVAWRGAVAVALLAVLVGTLTPGGLKKQWQDDSVVALKSISRQVAAVMDAAEIPVAETAAPMTRRHPRYKINRHLPTIFKAAHFFFFAILAGFLALALTAQPLLALLWPLGMLAAATEFMQIFISGRTALYGDWVIDLVGAASGLLVAFFCRRRGRFGKNMAING